MSVKDYQLEAGLNVSISGINIAEGCPPSGINDAIRQLMADVRAESDARQQAEAQNARAAQSASEAAAQAAQSAADAVAQASQSVSSLGNSLRSEMASAVAGAKSEAASADATLESTLRSLVSSEKAALQGQIQQAIPTGAVIAFAANKDPAGFLLCNGAEVSRSTYAALFAAIGTTYGAGNGSSTFALPNLADRFIQGSGTAGTPMEAGLPDHNHKFEHTQSVYTDEYGYNCIYTTKYKSNGSNDSQNKDAAVNRLGYASAVNSIYGKSSTVQPPALTMRYYIKY